MRSFKCVVLVMVVICTAVEAYKAGEKFEIVADCLNKENFERDFGAKMFEKTFVSRYKIKDIKTEFDRFFTIVNFNIDTKVANTDDFKPKNIEINLVEKAQQKSDSDYKSIALEIWLYKFLAKNRIAPSYKTCGYRIDDSQEEKSVMYYIVLENVDFDVHHFFKNNLSPNYPIAGKIYKFLQMAFLIQKLHMLGYTHQDIKPTNFVSTDEGMSDFRLIDFSLAAKDGSPGIGGTRYYFSPDKVSNRFTATFHQDAFAFALTLIKLIDLKGTFDTIIKEECISKPSTITDKCKESFIAGVEALKRTVELVIFFEYLKAHFFDKASPLNITDMMGALIKCYIEIDKKIPQNSPEKNLYLNGLVKNLVIEYSQNVVVLEAKEKEKLKKKSELEGTPPNIII